MHLRSPNPNRPARAASCVLAIALLLVGQAAPLQGQELSPEQTIAIDRIALEPIEDGRIAGVAIAVVRGNDTLHLRDYGYADLELGVEMPADAVFEIGSVTKQFTAVAMLQLAEQGKLSLDDPLEKWLPDYPVRGRTIPLRRLLDHTSGIKGYTEIPRVWSEITPLALEPDTLVSIFAAEPFEFEPGTALIYNNSAYFLAGQVIEAASGESYEDYVEKYLMAPAGMDDSRYCRKHEMVPNRAKGFQPSADGLRPADYLNHTWPYAAGSLCSTTRDLIAWNQALHGDGAGGSLLDAEHYELLISPEPLLDGTETRYAKGVGITNRGGTKKIAHGGGIHGFVSNLVYFPEEDLSIAVLINSAPGPTGEITSEIERIVLGEAPAAIPRSFTGDLEPFTGMFRGPARGLRLAVTVSAADGGRLHVESAPLPDGEVEWLGANTFAAGNVRYTFLNRGDGGSFDTLQVDHVGGLYVLERVTR